MAKSYARAVVAVEARADLDVGRLQPQRPALNLGVNGGRRVAATLIATTSSLECRSQEEEAVERQPWRRETERGTEDEEEDGKDE